MLYQKLCKPENLKDFSSFDKMFVHLKLQFMPVESKQKKKLPAKVSDELKKENVKRFLSPFRRRKHGLRNILQEQSLFI